MTVKDLSAPLDREISKINMAFTKWKSPQMFSFSWMLSISFQLWMAIGAHPPFCFIACIFMVACACESLSMIVFVCTSNCCFSDENGYKMPTHKAIEKYIFFIVCLLTSKAWLMFQAERQQMIMCVMWMVSIDEAIWCWRDSVVLHVFCRKYVCRVFVLISQNYRASDVSNKTVYVFGAKYMHKFTWTYFHGT